MLEFLMKRNSICIGEVSISAGYFTACTAPKVLAVTSLHHVLAVTEIKIACCCRVCSPLREMFDENPRKVGQTGEK